MGNRNLFTFLVGFRNGFALKPEKGSHQLGIDLLTVRRVDHLEENQYEGY